MNALLARLRRIDLRHILAALFAIAILHVITTFTAPSMALSSAWDRLAPALKPNTMALLPAVTPDAQPLPFMAPDFKVAVCMFDTRRGPVALSASLPSAGWNLTLYDPKGTAIHTATGRPDRATPVSLLLVPDDDRFMGLTPEAQGLRSPRQTELRIQARKGLAILRAPDMGYAYRARIDAELARASCRTVADRR
ncbi:MAG: hypothetical protein ACM3L9_10250 [Deltaproteobacteria bacterium]